MNKTAASEADKWQAIKFMARHIFLCWPRQWQYEWVAPDKDRRICQRCGLIHEYESQTHD
jgi:hypothetical protein